MSYNKRKLKRFKILAKLKISNELLELALKKFKDKFKSKPRSWLQRCIERLIDVQKTPKPNTWIVRGRPSLGDSEAFYIITFIPKRNRYMCTCYNPNKLFGNRRMKQICTHVGSVILWRLIKERDLHDFMDKQNNRKKNKIQ